MRKSGKKLVSAVMGAAMVLSLAACGGKTADTTTAATEAATTEAQLPRQRQLQQKKRNRQARASRQIS